VTGQVSNCRPCKLLFLDSSSGNFQATICPVPTRATVLTTRLSHPFVLVFDKCTNIRHISAIRHKAPLDRTFLPRGGHGGDFHWQGSASHFAFWIRLVVSPPALIKPLPLTANQYGCRVEMPGLTYPTGALGRRAAALKTNCPNLLHFPFPQDTFLAGAALK
jgi:hypothetical protein